MKAKDLKNSILQLAIQGKLVPQDPKDEPASKLLEKIRAAKQKLVKEGKIKKDKQESFIYKGDDNNYYEKIGTEVRNITGEIPFEIPDSWEWVRFKNLVHYRMGKTPQRKDEQFWEPGTFPWVSIADLISDGMVERTKEKISDYAVLQIFKGEFSPQGTLLMSFKLTVGKVSILNINAVHNEAIISIYPYLNTDNSIRDYLFKFMPLLSQEGRTKTAIKGKTLNSDSIDALLIPLPPVAEQKRIVRRIEFLEPYVEEYDKVASELTVLNESFPEQIKKSILQYAIQGKLVPQDPNDEPASVLLDKIKAEKQKLIKAGKIKKDKVESYIYKRDNRHYEKMGDKEVDITDEIPFKIPDSWSWVRLGNVMEIARGGSPRPIQNFLTNDPNGINWIKIGDTDKTGKYINSTKEKIIPEGMKKSRFVHKGDFLLTNSMSFGRPYILNIDGCIHDGWLVISNIYHLYNLDYLYYLLASPFAYSQFSGKVSGAVVKNLNSDKVASSLFPLPPLQEQKKIATKIEQIFKMLS